MNRLLEYRPSPAMVVACIALAIALGGTSYAAISLPKNSVGTKQLKKNAVKRSKIKAGAVTGAKVAADSLTGRNILESSLGAVPSAANATHATSADNATNATHATSADNATNANHATSADSAAPTGTAGGDLAGNYPNPSIATGAVTGTKVANDTLGGAQINEASLNYASAGCSMGLIHSFARIRSNPLMPATYTTSDTYVDIVHNCAGGTTEVRRAGAGHYFLRFNGDPAALALAVNNQDASCTAGGSNAGVVSLGKVTGGADAGAFEVWTYFPGAGFFDSACVTIVTF